MAGMLLHFKDETRLAQALAEQAGLERQCVELHVFPDGEFKLTLPPQLPEQLVVLRGLHDPNAKLVALMLLAGAARELGARHLTLVAPYLAYMRQDIAFSPGEAVSQRLVGRFLAQQFDAVITVDPHLHRVHTLAEAIPCSRAVALSAAALIGQHVARHRPGALLLAPDAEAEQWVAAAGQAAGLEWAVCHKDRHGDRQVQVRLPDGMAWAGRPVVLIDDVCSSGHTLAEAAQGLHKAGVASVDVAVTHALFAPGAEPLLRQAGIGAIWSTDAIAHASNAISVAGLLAGALKG